MKKLMTIAILAGVMATLTAAFGEDAYIANLEGKQFLNTGYCVCTNTRIEIDFQMLEIASSKYILASNNGSQSGHRDNLACEIYIGFNGVENFSFYTCTNGVLSGSNSSNLTSSGLRRGTNLYTADTNRHVIVVDYTLPTEHFQVWNGDFTQKLAAWTVPAPFLDNHRSTVPLALFGRCYRPSGIYTETTNYTMYAYSTKMKVYGLKIYEGGAAPENLVMHLVPHVKGGVAGFKDLCRPGRFVQGEIDGACTAGGDVTEEPDDPYIYSPRNTFSALSQRSVFLDTGYTVTPTTRVELDFAMLKNWATNSLYNINPYLIGAYGGSPKAFYFYAYGDDALSGYFRYGAGGTGNLTECRIDAAYNIRRTVSMNSNSVSLITAEYTNATAKSSHAVNTDLTTYTLKIGASFTGESRFLPMKVYGLKIYESDELVKDYLPFYRNGVAGLTNSLDAADILTSRTYIKNAIPDGVHTNVVFDAGGHVTDDPVEKEAYLEFDGVNGHSINTEYAISKDSCIEVDFAPWKTTLNNNYFDVFGQGQGESATSTIIWTRLYCGAALKYNYYFADAEGSSPSGAAFSVDMNHSRVQVKLDGANSKATITSEGKTLKNLTIKTQHTAPAGSRPLYIGGSYSGGTRCSAIRLYSLKISEAGTLARNFVPCMHEGQAGLYELCEGKFYPLEGGKVYGKGYTGQTGDFEVALPQTAKITKGTGSYELSCIAAGASSFEWYEDDKLIEGATTDSYTVEWTHKAPHTRTYKVVPVYTVFNEKVRGEAAEASVEISPLGIVIEIQ